MSNNLVSQIKQRADNFLGESLGLNVAKNTVSANSLPWKQSVPVSSRFWGSIVIDPARWDQLFPYRLLVVDIKSGNIVGGNTKGVGADITFTLEKNNTMVNFEPMGQQWVFRLPITPQQLTISDQFAISTSGTLLGVTEQHNGLKFKLIQLSGTMGVWPYRSSVINPNTNNSPSATQSLFGGTLSAAAGVASQISRVINTATSDHPSNKPKTLTPAETDQGETSTGYYQALALQQFLEQYAEAKKDPNNAGWRLILDIPKQNQSFVVTPMVFNWIQNENRPSEILYNMSLKAWRRISLTDLTSNISPSIPTLTPGLLQKVLNTITESRRLMSTIVDLIGAVRSDVERPLDVLRQTSLLVKDMVGAVVSAADLPFQIQRDYASSIKESMIILSSSMKQSSTDPRLRIPIEGVLSSSSSLEGLSMSSVAGGQLGKTASVSQSIDPLDNIFRTPERNFSLFDAVPVSTISLNSAQQETVDDAINAARNITTDDLRQFRNVIQELALQLSDNFGTGDAFYSQIYGTPTPKERSVDITVDEYEILKSLYDTMESYEMLAGTTDIDDNQKSSSMEYIAGLADDADIEFNISNSKILAPVPFGSTIEQIAYRYLGDPNRWLEIATLNSLRDPYIDENGFRRYLLSNASGRQITISSVEDMFVGQRVVLNSLTQRPSPRKILSIDRISDTSYLLSLDGESNLDNFLFSDSAYLQAYLPGTVNSQQQIFIPSDLPVPDSPSILTPAAVEGDPLVGLSKIDWLMTDTGDVATNSFGDFRLSAGLTNLTQAVKIKMSTVKNSLLLHPEFGIGIKPGMMSSEFTVQDIYNDINTLISDDPRFAGLDYLQINLNGPTLQISMGILIPGQKGVFPVSFEM